MNFADFIENKNFNFWQNLKITELHFVFLVTCTIISFLKTKAGRDFRGQLCQVGDPCPGEVAFLKSLGSQWLSQARPCDVDQGGDCAPQGTFSHIWKHFWLCLLGEVGGGQFATSIYWVETRETAVYLVMHRTAPTITNGLV